MSSHYKAILFDVGMTLIQPRFSDAEICAAICAQHGYSVPPAQIEEEMSNFSDTLVARYREKGDLWLRRKACGSSLCNSMLSSLKP